MTRGAENRYAATAANGRWWTEFDRRVCGVFEGGGAKGIAYSGALRALYDRSVWFDRVAGASAGAITAVLVAAGCTPDQIDTLAPTALGGLKPKSPLRGLLALRGRGCYFDERPLRRLLESLLIQKVLAQRCDPAEFSSEVSKRIDALDDRLHTGSKTGWVAFVAEDQPELQFVTFKELYEATGIELTIVAADITDKRLVSFNHMRTPSCQVTEAVLASSAIPVAFNSPRMQCDSTADQPIDTMIDGGVWANYPDFVFRDASFRSFSGLPPIDEQSVVIGFILDESATSFDGRNESSAPDTSKPSDTRFINREGDMLLFLSEYFPILARVFPLVLAVSLFFLMTIGLGLAYFVFSAAAAPGSQWWGIPLSIGVIFACIAGWRGKFTPPADVADSMVRIIPRVPLSCWGALLLPMFSVFIFSLIHGPLWLSRPDDWSPFSSVFLAFPLIFLAVVDSLLLIRVIQAADSSIAWRPVSWGGKSRLIRLILSAIDATAKLLHGPVGLIAFFLIVAGAAFSFDWILNWWGSLESGQQDWSQTAWFYLRGIIPPALLVVVVLVLAVGVLLIVNALLLHPVRRLGPNLFATFVAGAGAPQWAGFSERDLVVRIPIPDELGIVTFDAPSEILEEAKAGAYEATSTLLKRIVWTKETS